MDDDPKTTFSPLLDTWEPHRSEKIVRVLDRFMIFGDVVSDEHDLDPSSYNDAISNKDLENWQNVIKVEDDVYMIEPYIFIAKG